MINYNGLVLIKFKLNLMAKPKLSLMAKPKIYI